MDGRRLDKIHIRELLLRCIIGIKDDERRKKQDVMINITLHADLAAACRSDRIEDTVDYRSIKEKIIAAVEGSRHFLLEALAERVAGICLEDPLVARADVVIDKPGALRFANSVAVEVSRHRPGAEEAG